MAAADRREQIMSVLIVEREVTMMYLAAQFNVSRRTIVKDIRVLKDRFPLETSRGNGGGVKLSKVYQPYRMVITKVETEVLMDLMEKGSESDWKVVDGLLIRHSAYYQSLRNSI